MPLARPVGRKIASHLSETGESNGHSGQSHMGLTHNGRVPGAPTQERGRTMKTIIIATIALTFLAWAAMDALAQGYENMCRCGRPWCWMIAEYTPTGQTGDGSWELVTYGTELPRYTIRTFGAGWSCSHGNGG